MSVRELEARMSTLGREAAHLNPRLPLDSPWNAVLRRVDVQRYIGVQWYRGFTRKYQRELTILFRRWDRGELVKARIGERWQIVHRYETSPLASSPGKE